MLGEVTDTGRLEITWRGETIVDVDPTTVAVDGPVYDRPVARPAGLDALQADTRRGARPARRTAAISAASSSRCSAARTSPTSRWITDQYDRYVLGNTALVLPGRRGDDPRRRGERPRRRHRDRRERPLLASSTRDAGAQLALAEAYRNVAVTGARPLAVTDCLNFGAPTNPEVMWQFAETVDGLSEACLALEVPVTGGNVSLYNQTGDRGDPPDAGGRRARRHRRRREAHPVAAGRTTA